MEDIRLFAGIFALAVVCAVWAIGPQSIGAGQRKRKPLVRFLGWMRRQHPNGGAR